MNNEQLKEFRTLVDRFSDDDAVNETEIPGLVLFRSCQCTTGVPTMYDPAIGIIAAGQKDLWVDDHKYEYGPGKFILLSVDLPCVGKIENATKDDPYLAMKLDIDRQVLSELLVETGKTISNSNSSSGRGVIIGDTSEKMGDAAIRLLKLLDEPEDIPSLAPGIIRELFYYLLRSEYGSCVSQIVLQDSHIQRIASAIQRIKTNLNKTIPVEELAETVGMSVSSFHAHFKSVTRMTPLQYQKSLRLIKARNLMIANEMDAASTAYTVGYESPSQFSREYARMFGNPPGRDISLLKQQEGAIQQSAV